MNYCFRYILLLFCLVGWTVSLLAQVPYGEYHIRKVVIDAGHGGKDPGVVGKTLKEKDVVLSVALKTGALIKEKHPDVEIIYTRDKDIFVELHERANIANRNNADLFISLHANSVKNRNNTTAGGFEFFVLGMDKSNANMEVAMRENAVITYEKDYESKYEGYDPKSPESFIIFTLMQNAYFDQSMALASIMQEQFLTLSPIKKSRGVKQQPLLVIWRTTMPSMLIELGFLSNPTEENLMKKEDNLDKFSASISSAFSKYKSRYEQQHRANGSATVAQAQPETPAITKAEPASTISQSATVSKNTTTQTANDMLIKSKNNTKAEDDATIYCVQVFNSPFGKPTNDPEFKNLKEMDDVRCIQVGKLYKYTVGNYSTIQDAQKACVKLQKKFPGAFVVCVQENTIVPPKR